MEIQDQIEGEDIYGMEMAIHLKDQDIIKSQAPKGIEKFCCKKPTKEKRNHVEVEKLSDEEGDEEQENQMKNARRRKGKRKTVLPFLESDDDFVDETMPDASNVGVNKETKKGSMVGKPRMPSMVAARGKTKTAEVKKTPEVDGDCNLVLLSDPEEEEDNQMMNASRRRKKKIPPLPLLVSDESGDDVIDETLAELPDVQLDEKKEAVTRIPSMNGATSEECPTGIQGDLEDAEVQNKNFERGNFQKTTKNDQLRDEVPHKLKDSPSFTNLENHGGEVEGLRNMQEMEMVVSECKKEMLAKYIQGEKTQDELRNREQNNREKVEESTSNVKDKRHSNLEERTEDIVINDTLKENNLVQKQGEHSLKLDNSEKHSKGVDAIIPVQESYNQERENKVDETSESNVKAERPKERLVVQEKENKVSTDINHNLKSRECEAAQVEEEAALSVYFPCSQFSFVQSTSEDKTVSPCPLPPSPPSVSSLDVLDDIELNYGTPGLKSCFRQGMETSSVKTKKKELVSLEMKHLPMTQGKEKCQEKYSMADGNDQFERSEIDNAGDNRDKDSSRAANKKGGTEEVVQQEETNIAAVLNFDLVPEGTEENVEGMASMHPSSEKVTESLCLDDLQGLEDDWEDSVDTPVPMEIQTPNFSASKRSHQKSSVGSSFVKMEMGVPSSHSTPVTRKVKFIDDVGNESCDLHRQLSRVSGRSENIHSSNDKLLVAPSEDQMRQSKTSSPKEEMLPSDRATVSFSSDSKMDGCYSESDIGVNFDLNFDLNSLDDEEDDGQLPAQTTPVGFPSLHPNSLCLPKAESTPLSHSKSLRRSFSSLGMTSLTETSKRIFNNKTLTDRLNTQNSSTCKDVLQDESSGMSATAKGKCWTKTGDSSTGNEQSNSNVSQLDKNLLRKLSFCNTSDVADTEEIGFGEKSSKGSPKLDSSKEASVLMSTSATDSAGGGAEKEFTKVKILTESSASSKKHSNADTQEFQVDQSSSSSRGEFLTCSLLLNVRSMSK